MNLGRLGVWYSTDKLDGPQLRNFVRTVENNGYCVAHPARKTHQTTPESGNEGIQ